ncbi:MAG TPA: hypothetical protein VNP36_02295 [Burkholderiales bacterium]|nr:hypothetical protein [Burkholderiales bacterium]
MARPKKPTGPRGILTLRGQGLPPLFMPAGSPASTEGIEGFIVEGATATAAKQGVQLFGQTSRPVRNTASPFDFTIPTETGDQYLDLLEVAPLSYVDGSHDRGPAPYSQGELADRVWSEIQRKALKYGPPLAAIHLLVFPTDWRLHVSDGTLQLMAVFLAKRRHPFSTVVYFAPDDAGWGDLRVVHPTRAKPDDIVTFDEGAVRGVVVLPPS